MAGRRQHYLPRFLQRAFRYRTHQGQDYVHSHESARSYTPSTMGIGQERDFYGHADQSPADDNITRGEGALADIVNRLLDKPNTVPQEDYALLVAALSVRTKKMREAMAGLVKAMASSFAEAFKEQSVMRHQIDVFWNDKKKLNAMIDEEVRKMPAFNREMRFRAKAFVRREWERKKEETYEELQRGAVALADKFFERLDAESAEVADKAFRQVFEKDPSIPDRVVQLRAYTFITIEADEGEFILGDCAGVGVRTDGEVRLAIGDLNEEVPLGHIFLPISPTRCVIGLLAGGAYHYKVDEINRFSASLSHRFFVSRSAQIHGLNELKSLIGTAEAMATNADIEMLMKSIKPRLER